MSDYKLTEQTYKQRYRELREEVLELRKFKHSVDYFLHPGFEEAWLAGYNSEFQTYEKWREHVRNARKEAARKKNPT